MMGLAGMDISTAPAVAPTIGWLFKNCLQLGTKDVAGTSLPLRNSTPKSMPPSGVFLVHTWSTKTDGLFTAKVNSRVSCAVLAALAAASADVLLECACQPANRAVRNSNTVVILLQRS